MAFDYRDLTGDYVTDFPVIKEMFQALSTDTTFVNMEGPIIEHQFSSLTNEVIDHKLERVPTNLVPTKFEGAQATFLFVSADSKTVTLIASDALLKLSFYLE